MRLKTKHVFMLAGALIAITALSASLMVQLSISGPQSITQNQCSSSAYTVTAGTVFGGRNAQKDLSVSLSTQKNTQGVTFYSDSGCAQATTAISVSRGAASAEFYVKTTGTDDFVIVTTAKGALNGTISVHVIPAPVIPPPPVSTSNTLGVLVGDASFTNDQKIAIAKSLGVSYMRVQVLTQGLSLPLSGIDADLAAGLKIIPSLRNTNSLSKYSDPVTDINGYKNTISQFLSHYKPDVVAVENEEDNKAFIPNTSVDLYVAQLQAVIDVAHPLGVKVTNGGISFPDVALATWDYLWTNGQQAQADAYAQALSTVSSSYAYVLKDLPSQASPTKPILAHNAVAKAGLDRTNQLLAKYKGMNIDYINFHWYSGVGNTMQQTASFLTAYTGKPAMTNELGQWDQSPDTVTTLLKEVQASHLAYAIWYSGDGDTAVALQNSDTTLRPNGTTFQSDVKSMFQ